MSSLKILRIAALSVRVFSRPVVTYLKNKQKIDSRHAELASIGFRWFGRKVSPNLNLDEQSRV